jgi:hypothetical protein
MAGMPPQASVAVATANKSEMRMAGLFPDVARLRILFVRRVKFNRIARVMMFLVKYP